MMNGNARQSGHLAAWMRRVVVAGMMGIGAIAGAQPATPGSIPDPVKAALMGKWFDETGDVQAWIEKSKPLAKRDRKRLLILWGANTDESTEQLHEIMTTPDSDWLRRSEYIEMWAEIGKGERAAANLALAKSLGAKIKPGELTMLTVLDEDGKHVASQSVKKMVDTERSKNRTVYAVLKLQDFLHENRTERVVASEAIESAIAKVKSSGASRGVLVAFGEFEDVWSGRFSQLLETPSVKSELAKHVDVLELDMARVDGGRDVLEKHVPKPQSLPEFLVYDADGKVVGVSQPKGQDNIGYPTDDSEIDRLLVMLRLVRPALSEAEGKALRTAIHEATAAILAPKKGPPATP